MDIRKLLGILLALGLLTILACGPSEEAKATPTPTSPSLIVTVQPPPELILPTPTATPTRVPAGVTVTAVPTPTSIPAPTATPGEQPKYGGRVTEAVSDLPSYDPLSTLTTGWTWWGWGNLWSQLIRVNPVDRVTVEGDLAESWSVSADGTEYKFKMRPGVVTHQGEPYTANDAYWYIYRIVEQPGGVPAPRHACIRAYLKDIADGKGVVLPAPGAEVTGPSELTMRLRAPRGAFISCLAGAFVQFTPSKYTKAIDTAPGAKYRDLDPKKGELVGTGPFKLKATELDNFLELERFDKYFRQGRPYLDGLTAIAMLDGATRIAAFRVGRVDALPLFSTPNKRDADKLKQDLGDQMVNDLVLALGYRGFQFNVNTPPYGPMSDPNAKKIRNAVQWTLNRSDLNLLQYQGLGFLSAPYFIGWDWIYTEKEYMAKFPGLDSSPAAKARDIAAAKKLMEGIGYGPSNRLKLEIITNVNSDEQAVEGIVSQLKEIYIDVQLISIASTGISRDRAVKGDFQAIYTGFGAPFPDPDAYNYSAYNPFTEGGFGYSNWLNPRWAELRDKQALLNTDKDRGPILREMADILYDDSVFVFVNRPILPQIHRGNWRGYVPGANHVQTATLENVWLTK